MVGGNPEKYGWSLFDGITAKINKGILLKYSLILDVILRNRIDPKILQKKASTFGFSYQEKFFFEKMKQRQF